MVEFFLRRSVFVTVDTVLICVLCIKPNTVVSATMAKARFSSLSLTPTLKHGVANNGVLFILASPGFSLRNFAPLLLCG
jgi:hypothetical protein